MSQLTRMPVILPLAGVVTIGVFMAMRGMIQVPELPRLNEPDRPSFVISETVEPYEPHRNVTPDHIEPVTPPPPAPRLEIASTQRPGAETIQLVALAPEVEVGEFQPNRFQAVDTDEQPIYRVPPVYPDRALQRNLEGHCVIVFDITAQGQTTNARVSACSDAIFGRASVRAVQQWRFQPRMEGGQAQMRRNRHVRLDFRIGD
ncbi:energy transducer TonB [Maricaulis sp. D1M11]|uniref:energy transducer TonB n=1 Tax=Maricaulis sp. D1M11 TaxID=3076117 RepID=UPI0039B55BA5